MLNLIEYPADFLKPVYAEEHHGNEIVKNVSIYVELSVNADVLEAIKPGLKEALFIRPALNDSARIGEDGSINDLVRRFATMEPLRLEDEYPGYEMIVHGDLIESARKWIDVEVAKISIQPEDGGTARVKFRAQMTGDGVEWWVLMMGRSSRVTLEPPKAAPLPAEHPDNDGDDEDPFAGSDLAANAAQPPVPPKERRARRNGAGATAH